MNFYIGCPIWSFKGWVGNFYPQGTKPGDFLREYTRRLTTVEGNTTFYTIPPKKTILSWVAEMPETFRFCPKLPRAISHEGTLTQHSEDALSFVEIMDQLGVRLGPMFLQLPPRYSPSLLADLEAFLVVWPRDVRLAVEVRHLDWFDAPHHEALNQLLAQYNMARVVIDTRPIRNLKGDKILRGSAYESLLEARERKPNVPVIPDRTADFIFIRYIGHPKEAYNMAFLTEWAGYLVSQLREGANAYVFCHSPDNMIAPDLCRELHQRVAEQIPVPPLPWDEADANTLQQGRLF
ncbi:MAG: DUF72 domain-containing protein [Anaerolineales bacterium]|nr:DUF72 domain-containing protein [Anaerolineales bacterium]